MRRWWILLISILFALPLVGRAEGVVFYKGTVYQGLDEARAQKKLLLVEFYAPWSHKSRWMHDNVLTKSDLNDRFVVVSVDTNTEDGAALAVQYEVMDYPVILVCSAGGVVIDKIDRALDLRDFESRLNTVSLSTDRQGVKQLQQIFSLCESDDPLTREKVNALTGNYIASQSVKTLTSQSLWDLFSTDGITYYGSASYWFLVRNVDHFFSTDDARSRVKTIVADLLMPYIVGSKEFDEDFISTIESDSLSLIDFGVARELCNLARLRASADVAMYVTTLAGVVDRVAESYEFQLIMSLDFVANNLDRTERSTRTMCRKMVEKLMRKSISPSKTAVIESLLDKFL